jgi:glycine/D-amino acid oxidase-like deaminating enzyme
MRLGAGPVRVEPLFMSDSIFAPGFIERPFWWDAAAPVRRAGGVPGRADAVIIGGGIAGLSTALELARGGAKPVVLDREPIGWGASSRNGGALSGAGALGRSKGNLQTSVDPEILAAMVLEAEQSFEAFEQLIEAEGLDCDYRRTGRFVGAHAAKAMDALQARAEMLNRTGVDEGRIVARKDVGQELATERYFGGLVIRRAGAVHPGKYVQELARVAEAAGASLHGGVTVEGYAREGDGFRVRTSAGEIQADALMVATNGYTGPVTPWQRRRVIPVASFMIATEVLGAERVARLLPKLRVYGDTKKILYYFRPSPDGERILFGGRASFVDGDVRRAGARLLRFLVDLIPELAGTRITHAWKGNVAFAFDMLPHVGAHEGVHYALACNGSGVVTMTHLGRQAARQMLGRANQASAFSLLPFPTMPGYSGNPWFMPIVGSWYRLKDRFDGWREPGWP